MLVRDEPIIVDVDGAAVAVYVISGSGIEYRRARTGPAVGTVPVGSSVTLTSSTWIVSSGVLPTTVRIEDIAVAAPSTDGGTVTPDADATTKGKLRLTGDLSGTADLPTVPALATLSSVIDGKMTAPSGAPGQVLMLGADGLPEWISFTPSVPTQPVRDPVELGNMGAATPLDLSTRGNEVVATGTLTANNTTTITGMTLGDRVHFMVRQDGTGGRTWTLSNGGTTYSVTLPATTAGTAYWLDVWHDGSVMQVGDAAVAHLVLPALGVPTSGVANNIDSLLGSSWINTAVPAGVLRHADSDASVRELLVELGGKGNCAITASSTTVTISGTPTTPFVVGQAILGDGLAANSKITGPGVRGDQISTGTFTLNTAAVGTKTTLLKGNTPFINTGNFTTKVIVAPLDTPYVPVDHTGSTAFVGQAYAAGFKQMINNGVPIPAGTTPPSDSDSTLCIIQPDWVSADGTLHGRMYELWVVKSPTQNASGRWSCTWGRRMTGTNERGNPISIDRNVQNTLANLPTDANYAVEGKAEEKAWGVMATRLPFSHNIIRADELARKEIQHAIGFMTAPAASTVTAGPVYPASNADTGSRPLLPQGSRFYLDPSFVVDTTRPWQWQMMVVAMKKYGVVFDDTAANLAMRAELGTGSFFSSYPGNVEQLMRDLPWGSLIRIAVGSDSNQNPVAIAVSNTVAPNLRGVGAVGFPLNIEPGTWAGNPPPTFTYKFQWNNAGTWTDIITAQTYTPVAADVGRVIRGVVTATKDPAQGIGSDPAPVVTSNTVTVATAASFAVIEQGAGASGAALTARAAEQGGSWTMGPGGSSPLVTTGTGWIRQNTIGVFSVPYIGTQVTGNSGEVRARIRQLTNVGGGVGVGWWDNTVQTGYMFRLQGGGSIDIIKALNGTVTTLAIQASAYTVGHTYDVRAVAAAGALSLYLDGSSTPALTATDPSPLANLGWRALRYSAQTAVGNSAGYQVTDIRA